MNTPREGSSLYYSLLWTEASSRQRFLDRLALIHTLNTSLDDTSEAQVVQQKIHWWHDELQRMIDGEARHPACRAVQQELRGNTTARDHALSLLSSTASRRLSNQALESDTDQQIEIDFSARLALLAHSLSQENHDLRLPAHSRSLARGLGWHEQLARLPHLLHRGLPVFSDESYRQAGLRVTDLVSRIRVAGHATGQSAPTAESEPTTEVKVERCDEQQGATDQAIARLLAETTARSLQDLQQAIRDNRVRGHFRRAPLMPLWRWIVLRERQLQLWQRQPPNLLRERRSLTPLNKLFHAWRNRR